jgi:hypothetical protein
LSRSKWNLVIEARKWFVRAQHEYQYRYGMDTLYEMCQRVPDHRDLGRTMSKVWLIGRSHSASLERRRDSKGFRNPYDATAVRLQKDRTFTRLLVHARRSQPSETTYDARHLGAIHALVSRLAALFQGTTGMWKVSLASKYLHFHVPEVPIYDSISSTALRMLVPKKDVPPEAVGCWELDDAYGRHLARFAAARSILSSHGYNVTARNLDMFLLFWWG